MSTPTPAEILTAAIATARTAALDSNVRFADDDFTVTDAESIAYRALIEALKGVGVISPMEEILDKAEKPLNFRTA